MYTVHTALARPKTANEGPVDGGIRSFVVVLGAGVVSAYRKHRKSAEPQVEQTANREKAEPLQAHPVAKHALVATPTSHIAHRTRREVTRLTTTHNDTHSLTQRN